MKLPKIWLSCCTSRLLPAYKSLSIFSPRLSNWACIMLAFAWLSSSRQGCKYSHLLEQEAEHAAGFVLSQKLLQCGLWDRQDQDSGLCSESKWVLAVRSKQQAFGNKCVGTGQHKCTHLLRQNHADAPGITFWTLSNAQCELTSAPVWSCVRLLGNALLQA